MKEVSLCLLLLGVLIVSACSRPDDATRVLTQAGYTQIQITGWRPFVAGKDETYSTGFTATAPNGSKVSGAVTRGLLFKGSTIRID